MQVTFKTIMKDFEDFSNQHQQIETFSWGELYNISTKDTNFPLFHVMPVSTKKNGSLQQMNIELYIMDLEKHDDTNLIDIMSNLFEIGNDIVSYFFERSDILDFEIDEKNVNFYPFTGDFDDLTAGWKIQLTIEYIQTNNKCNIPL